MRIVALSAWWPEPADNGARLRIARLLRALAERHEVHLVALAQAPVMSQQIARMEQVVRSAQAIPQRTWTPATASLIQSLWRSEPQSVRATYSPQFDAAARSCAARVHPDLVIAFTPHVAPYARRIANVPKVLEEIEVARLWEQYAQARSPRRRARHYLTWWKQQRYLQHMLRDFDACTVVSARERQLVQRCAPPRLPIVVLPNGADIADRVLASTPEPDTLIYPGALSYDANYDAMRYFVGAIWPLVRHERPRARLRITGHATAEQREALAADGVEFTGYVSDIRSLIAGTWAEVVPLRIGGGTRLKVLEALALGTPVVSTPKGVEGLELEPERHALVADDPVRFAHATIRLLADPSLRQRLAQSGQRIVRERYAWPTIGKELHRLIEQVTAHARTT
jgi:polysaccharide biosynthesis protein PslH